MKINENNLKNPYVQAYASKKNLRIGDTIPNVDYMLWINKKHDEFRGIHGIPEHVILIGKDQEEFIGYINQ